MCIVYVGHSSICCWIGVFHSIFNKYIVNYGCRAWNFSIFIVYLIILYGRVFVHNEHKLIDLTYFNSNSVCFSFVISKGKMNEAEEIKTILRWNLQQNTQKKTSIFTLYVMLQVWFGMVRMFFISSRPTSLMLCVKSKSQLNTAW